MAREEFSYLPSSGPLEWACIVPISPLKVLPHRVFVLAMLDSIKMNKYLVHASLAAGSTAEPPVSPRQSLRLWSMERETLKGKVVGWALGCFVKKHTLVSTTIQRYWLNDPE